MYSKQNYQQLPSYALASKPINITAGRDTQQATIVGQNQRVGERLMHPMILVHEASASLLPLALRAPLIPSLHAIHLAALLDVAATALMAW